MRVSFQGKTYDPDRDDEALRAACEKRARELVAMLEGEESVRGALTEMVSAVQHIAVKLGATAALSHAYSADVDYMLVDTFAHVLNKLVGLQYVPPEQILKDPRQETSSGNEEDEGAGKEDGAG